MQELHRTNCVKSIGPGGVKLLLDVSPANVTIDKADMAIANWQDFVTKTLTTSPDTSVKSIANSDQSD